MAVCNIRCSETKKILAIDRKMGLNLVVRDWRSMMLMTLVGMFLNYIFIYEIIAKLMMMIAQLCIYIYS